MHGKHDGRDGGRLEKKMKKMKGWLGGASAAGVIRSIT